MIHDSEDKNHFLEVYNHEKLMMQNGFLVFYDNLVFDKSLNADLEQMKLFESSK